MQAVQIAMDRKDREREHLSTLLSNLYPSTISQDQMAKGFTRLLQFTEVHTHSNICCIGLHLVQLRGPQDVLLQQRSWINFRWPLQTRIMQALIVTACEEGLVSYVAVDTPLIDATNLS